MERGPHGADRVADVVDDYRLVAPMPSLEAILHAHPDLGPPTADALRTAADALMDRSANRPEWEARQSFGLALEMRAHVDGLDAVVAMARADTPERLEVTAWAVDRLVEGSRLEEAAALAHETMAVTASSHRLAVLADTAANVDAQLDRPAFAAAASAWAAHPTISRLEAVLDAASPNEHTSFIGATAEHPPHRPVPCHRPEDFGGRRPSGRHRRARCGDVGLGAGSAAAGRRGVLRDGRADHPRAR